MQSGVEYAFHSAVKSEARARKLPKSQLAFQRIHWEKVQALQDGAFAPEAWALTTETSGGGEEAHRRWPKGCSERGASKAKHRPPRIRGDSVYSRAVFLCASASLREELDEFGDHCEGHPKTAGRTNTGGPVFSERIREGFYECTKHGGGDAEKPES